ncbi:VID27 cytoplasmic protein-domain-containing protein [Protomyces lactucae-debilis]|uniref:VID27 cytoplasmic protein-domain-containing protein n=1 Tax=Protomyces lactucae-debilis TaxID=2754530 RepID=A0A1Y2FNZ3_PROLT|nr:VID27 cytoplasmic protein-domain-containing protein [Protomyces lactucae-debilis]ORY84435.1 VID27 cytoplasmic protein-domain-containing protein [Protomyces lactucae-debilis]
MFALRSLSKKLFGTDTKLEICTIAAGQLYLVRPGGIKGFTECIFKDAQATIRRTNTPYHYQLVIERAFEEGEEDLEEDGLGDDDRDLKSYLLDESIRFCTSDKDGCTIFQWRDVDGDMGDSYTFVCDPSTKPEEAATFELVAVQCLYERKYRKSYEEATEEELEEFRLDSVASPVTSLPTSPGETKQTFRTLETSPSKNKQLASTPAAVSAPSNATEELVTVQAELHLFDASAAVFVLQHELVTATVSETGKWEYWLSIRDALEAEGKLWLGQPMEAEMNPVFNYEQLCFIWNYYDDDSNAFSWLLKFKDAKELEKFQEGVMRALWEHLNELRWGKQKDDERAYLMSLQEEDEEMEQFEEEEEAGESEDEQDAPVPAYYDEDEEEDEVPEMTGQGENSQLAVGYKHDRSFVVRGDKIGVFRHTDDNKLEFATSINKVQKLKGAKFNPSKVMLHNEDTNMILQDPNDSQHLFKMDLEYGKVVEEWKVHDDVPLHTFTAAFKYAGMTSEQTLVGLSKTGLYRIDPRLAGTKLVDSEYKQYKSANDFSAAATTEAGHIAVASAKGDIRLYDRLGINAKTALPPMSAPIIGMDVSADGKWVLATTKTYILLIDTTIQEGKNAGSSGFTKSFGKDSKPRPRILQLEPEHVAMMQGKLSFTPAKFNAGVDTKETSIVTSTGPFVISWTLNQVVNKSQAHKYRIRKYAEEVKADNFKFGSDKNVIVALPNDVSMVSRRSLKNPTRESLSTPVRQLRSRSSIVNSPY